VATVVNSGAAANHVAIVNCVWRGVDSGTVCLWRLANCLLCCRRSTRAAAESAARSVFGVLGVIVVYLSVNYVCVHALGRARVWRRQRPPASAVMRLALGEKGGAFLAAGIANFHHRIPEPEHADRAASFISPWLTTVSSSKQLCLA